MSPEAELELEGALARVRANVEHAETALEVARRERNQVILEARGAGIAQRRVGELAGVSGPYVHQLEEKARV